MVRLVPVTRPGGGRCFLLPLASSLLFPPYLLLPFPLRLRGGCGLCRGDNRQPVFGGLLQWRHITHEAGGGGVGRVRQGGCGRRQLVLS
jgi:hypothetical protein